MLTSIGLEHIFEILHDETFLLLFTLHPASIFLFQSADPIASFSLNTLHGKRMYCGLLFATMPHAPIASSRYQPAPPVSPVCISAPLLSPPSPCRYFPCGTLPVPFSASLFSFPDHPGRLYSSLTNLKLPPSPHSSHPSLPKLRPSPNSHSPLPCTSLQPATQLQT